MFVAERISADPEGHLIVEGTELKVAYILGLLAAGESEAAIIAKHTGITREDILACIAYGSYAVKEFGGRSYID